MQVDENMKLPDSIHDHVIAQLLGKDWKDIEVIEHYGHLLFPDKLFRRNKDGSFESIDIYLRVPREPELRQARVKARKIAADDGLDLDRDIDLVETLECICTLSVAVRNNTKPFEPYEPDPKRLEGTYDRGSLTQLWAKLNEYSRVVDPRPDNITAEEILVLMASISKEKNIYPLHVYGPAAQNSFITIMAGLSLNYLTPKSSSERLELLTPE
jgi:hypothetical protein